MLIFKAFILRGLEVNTWNEDKVLTDLNDGRGRSEDGKGAEAAKVKGEWWGCWTLSYCDTLRWGCGGIREVFRGKAGGMSLLLLLLLSSMLKSPLAEFAGFISGDVKSRFVNGSDSQRSESRETFGETSM